MVLRQVGAISVVDTTTFSMVLNLSAKSPSRSGQAAANPWYVVQAQQQGLRGEGFLDLELVAGRVLLDVEGPAGVPVALLAAGRLDDAVQRDELSDVQGAHGDLFSGGGLLPLTSLRSGSDECDARAEKSSGADVPMQRTGRAPESVVQSFVAGDSATHRTPVVPSWSAITVSEGASLSSTTVPPAATAAAIRCSATSGAT